LKARAKLSGAKVEELLSLLYDGGIFPFVCDNSLKYVSFGLENPRLLGKMEKNREDLRKLLVAKKEEHPSALLECLFFMRPWHKELVEPPAVMSFLELRDFLRYLRSPATAHRSKGERLERWKPRFPRLEERHVMFYREDQ